MVHIADNKKAVGTPQTDNVTGLRRKRGPLQKTEEIYHLLISRTPAVFWISGRNGEVIFISPQVKDICGYTPEEIYQKGKEHWLGRIHPEDIERVKREYSLFIEKGDYLLIEYRIKRKNGKLIWLRDSGVRISMEGKTVYTEGFFIDITEQKKAEEAYRTLVENTLMGSLVLQDDSVVFANQALVQISGYTMEEWLNFSTEQLGSIVHPEDRELVFKWILERKEGKPVPEKYEFRIFRKDGEVRWVEQYVSLMNYLERTATKILCIDITKRKKAEKALKDREETFRLLTEKSVLGKYIIQDYKIVYVNPSFAKTMGYEPEEIAGNMTPSDIIHPDDIDIAMKKLGERFEGEEPEDIRVIKAIRKDGSIIYIEAYGMLIEYHGKPAVIGTILDVTERMKAEERLKESEEKFRSIAEHSMMGIAIVQDNVIKYVNKAAAEMYGYTVEEVLNFKPLEFFKILTPDTLEIAEEQAIKKQRGDPDQLKHYIFHGITKNGKPIWVDNYSSTVSYQGRPADLVAQVDITERIQMENKIHQVREAERNRLARELHDAVSQTLSSAGIIAEVLPAIWERDQNEGRKRLAELVSLTRGAQEEMRSLLFELLPATVAEKDLGDLIKQLVTIMRRRTNMNFRTYLKGQLCIDDEIKTSLYRVTQEALNNVVKHSRAQNVKVKLICKPDNSIILKIKDDGQGFDIKSTSPRSLGLRIMRERTDAIGASLSVTSTPGQGTEIVVYRKSECEIRQ